MRAHIIFFCSESDCRPGAHKIDPPPSHIFVGIDHEIISTVILLPLLIQEGVLSITSESVCLKYWLTA